MKRRFLLPLSVSFSLLSALDLISTAEADDGLANTENGSTTSTAPHPQNNERLASARRLMELSLLGALAQGVRDGADEDTATIVNDLRLLLTTDSSQDEKTAVETLLTESWNRVVATQSLSSLHKASPTNIDDPQAERDSSTKHCLQHGKPIVEDYSYFADRHIVEILNTFQSFDCLEREFSVNTSDPDTFGYASAREVFEKCHILVLRNVFSKQEVHELQSKFENYIGQVYMGRIKPKSDGMATTMGGDSIVLCEGSPKRWNILPPRDLVAPNILANPVVMNILAARHILGSADDEDFIVNHIGNINAESGAEAQGWHSDGIYLHGEDSLLELGVAGHDLPPYAVNMFTPLLDMTPELGPTEFCLGTGNLRGLSRSFYNVLDKRLFRNGVAEALYRFDSRRGDGPCPPGFSRIPLLNMGDVVLVDYMMTHRGGSNNSNRLRSLLFITYSRKWYHDSNFDISNDEEDEANEETVEKVANELTKWTRFAVVDAMQQCSDQQEDSVTVGTCQNDESVPDLPPLETISRFLEAYDGWNDMQ